MWTKQELFWFGAVFVLVVSSFLSPLKLQASQGHSCDTKLPINDLYL
ncbi:MAG: hypothetical protein WBB82_15880 [Limnothrix sp.]